MTSYVPLGSRTTTAAKDTTGYNTAGRWTNSFTDRVLALSVPVIEVYHAAITACPAGAAATVTINGQTFSATAPGTGQVSEWDPSQPAILRDSDQLDFLWNVATTQTPAPVVTIWLRYDPDHPANQGA